MKRGKTFNLLSYLFIAALFAVLLCSCGNAGREPIGGASTEAETVGLDVCVTCHITQTADWKTSKHANIDPAGDLNSAGTPSYADFSDATCAACHDQLGDGQRLTTDLTGNVARPVTGCESCHGGGSQHYGTGPIALLGGASANEIGSAQFNTCTSCHELLNSEGTGTVTATHDPAGVSPMSSNDVITDTHFATPGDYSGTNTANVKDITGYVMDYQNERVCTNCHNPHKPPTINREWAQSAHADKTAAGAWAHYNWSSRTACQRCHTTTGFIAYADALRTGGVYSPPLTSDSNYKPEMLECNGCHIDYKGTLRNPGAITADYGYSATGISSAASYAYPDVSSSNVCMACHTGRESGDSIQNAIFSDISTTNFTNFSFINSHYLTAGGTIFASTGYEYPERSYVNSVSYMHDKIGSAAAQNTGANGPCVTCHMSFASQKHLFLPVSRVSATDKTVTAVTSSVCDVCHIGGDPLVMSKDMLNNQKVMFEEALEALWYQLFKKGYYFNPGSPYFVQKRYNSGSAVVTTGSDSVTGISTTWTAAGIVSSLTGTGDQFAIDIGSTWYAVKSVETDTLITLSTPYTGPTVTTAYVIIKQVSSTNVQKNWLSSGDTDSTGNTTGKKNMGAAFDYNILEHDPGAYAHNRYYTKRLIYDSIDWLDNNDLDYSVGETLNALDGAKYPFKTEAMHYLLPNGVTGNAVERP